MGFHLRLYIFLSLLCCVSSGYGQLTAPSANLSDVTEYQINGAPDSIFVFNTDNQDKKILSYPGGGSWDFEWSVYNSQSGNYEVVQNFTDTIAIMDDITSTTGYRLVQTNGSETDTFRCWVIINDFSIEFTDPNTSCNLIQFRMLVYKNLVTYYHPLTDENFRYLFEYPADSVIWENTPEEASNLDSGNPDDYYDSLLIYFPDTKPYYEDTWYRATVTDNAGLKRSDTIMVEAYVPKAEFEFEHISLDNDFYYPNKSEDYYRIYSESNYGVKSAPARFLFTIETTYSDSSTIYFGDESVGYTSLDTISHLYQLPGSYTATIYAHKFSHIFDGCEDSVSVTLDEIEPASLTVPNVTTVPADENKWRFYDVSITDFEIVIFNKLGRKVHHFKGNIRDWAGWDGRVNNSNNYVPTGVYYYVVKDFSKLSWYIPLDENGEPDPPDEIPEGEFTGGDSSGSESKNNNNVYRGFFHVFNIE